MEHSAILSTFIKLPFVFKTFVLCILSGRLTQVLLYMYEECCKEKLKTAQQNGFMLM